MHHLSKAESICQTIDEMMEKTSKPINYIVVSIGEFSSILQEHMDNAFDILKTSHDYLSHIEIRYRGHPGTYECLECEYRGSAVKKIEYSENHGIDPMIYCNNCNSSAVSLLDGTDVHLAEVGYEKR